MSETTTTRNAKRRRRFGRVFVRRWASGRKTYSAQWYDQTRGRRVTRHFDSEKLAKEFLGELERQVLAKVYETPPTQAQARSMPLAEEAPEVPRFIEYAETLLRKRLVATLAPSTCQLYSANLLALASFYGARDGRAARRLDEIDVASFLDYRAFRRSTRNHPDGRGGTVSAATVNRDQQFLSRVLSEAVLDGHLARNALAGLRKLKEPRQPRRWLSKEEIATLIAKSSKRFRPLVVAAVTTGARKCELTRLRWGDVDFSAGKIAIFRQKTGTSDSLDLHPLLARELLALKARRGKKRPVKDADPIFLSRRGVAFTNVSRSWELAVEAAGLAGREGLTFHSLRHSFATWFLSDGGAVTDLQAQLGHADLATTQRYAAAISERRRASVMAMEFAARPTPARATKPHAATGRERRSA
jgi:integrase